MKNEEIIFAVIAIIAGLVTLSFFVWMSIKYPSEKVRGERFVKDEIPILPIFGIYFKPITIMIISTFVFWACALESLRKYIMKVPMLIKRLTFIFFSLIVLVIGYELFWNFSMWTSAHILNPNLPLDSLSHQLNPAMTHPINFTYATKLSTLYIAISLYSIFFL